MKVVAIQSFHVLRTIHDLRFKSEISWLKYSQYKPNIHEFYNDSQQCIYSYNIFIYSLTLLNILQLSNNFFCIFSDVLVFQKYRWQREIIVMEERIIHERMRGRMKVNELNLPETSLAFLVSSWIATGSWYVLIDAGTPKTNQNIS